MAYFTATQARFLQPDLKIADLSDQAIEDLRDTVVEPLINHTLSGEYTVPFTGTAPPIITAVGCMFVMAYSLDGKWGRSGPGTESTQASFLRDQAYRILDELADPAGGKQLLDSSGDVVGRVSSAVASTDEDEQRHKASIFVNDETDWAFRTEERAD